MVWYSHLLKNFPQFVVIHTVKSFGIVNKAEVDVFLELSHFFNDPMDVGDLISASSAFSKSILNIWKFKVHGLLKPGLKNFAHQDPGERNSDPTGDLPVDVWESLVNAWVSGGLLQGWGHGL